MSLSRKPSPGGKGSYRVCIPRRLSSLIRRRTSARGSASATAAPGSVGLGRRGSRTPAFGGRRRQGQYRSLAHRTGALSATLTRPRRRSCTMPDIVHLNRHPGPAQVGGFSRREQAADITAGWPRPD